jgi:GDP-L-fucose synthase
MKKILFLIAAIAFNASAKMRLDSKIFVAGHRGLVGSAILRRLQKDGFSNLVTRTSIQLDLRNQSAVEKFFSLEKPEYVFLAAAKAGGIKANINYPAEFIYNNLAIQTNVIHAAYKNKVEKLLFLGSSCIYPRGCRQPIKEEYLMTQPLETSNEHYALAKIAGLKMCQAYNIQYGTNFISCMPTSLYGPGDNFDLNKSHVLPALINKFCNAKQKKLPSVNVWGSGNAMREFLYVDDVADAALFLMQNYNSNIPVNIGTGIDVTIKQLARMVSDVAGFKGRVVFDRSKPSGTPRKLLDITLAKKIGWHAKIELNNGIKKTVKWYLENIKTARR